MDLINRYVYDVVRRLPERQRVEIDKELRGLIADMLMARIPNGEPATTDIKAVLIELGDPAKLADNYRGSRRYLIGPAYFDKYVSLLKIVMSAVFIGLSVALAVSFVSSPPESILIALTKYIGSIFGAMLQVFAWVTGGFALAEYNSAGQPKEEDESEWTPADLPDLPVKAALIPPSEPIVAIGFSVVFMSILNFAPELFGVISFSGGQLNASPLFQLEVLRRALPAINVLFAISIIKEGFKLYYGKWTQNLAIGNTALNIATIALAAVLFSPNAEIWNTNVSPLLQSMSRYFVLALGIGLVVDSVMSLIKAAKHSRAK